MRPAIEATRNLAPQLPTRGLRLAVPCWQWRASVVQGRSAIQVLHPYQPTSCKPRTSFAQGIDTRFEELAPSFTHSIRFHIIKFSFPHTILYFPPLVSPAGLTYG